MAVVNLKSLNTISSISRAEIFTNKRAMALACRWRQDSVIAGINLTFPIEIAISIEAYFYRRDGPPRSLKAWVKLNLGYCTQLN